MASLNFPSSPVDGEKYTLNGITYTYNATVQAWLTTLLQALTISNTSSSYDTQVIFNNSGTATGAPGLVFDYTANTLVLYNGRLNNNLTVSNNAIVTGNVTAGFFNGNGANISNIVAYTAVNSAFGVINAAFGVANNAYTTTNGAAAFGHSNLTYNAVNSAFGVINAAFGVANAKVATVSGTSGRITSSGTTGITLDLSTAGPGAGSYSSGISALTLDAYGRVTAVTGGANYITSAGIATGFSSTTQDSQFNSVGVGTAASAVAGEIRALDNITAYYSSDISLKENVKKIENALNKLFEINGYEYDWSDEYIKSRGGEDGYFIRKHDVGVIAQEIEKVLPEVVSERENGIKAVKYDRIVPLLIEAIKELKTEIDELRKN